MLGLVGSSSLVSLVRLHGANFHADQAAGIVCAARLALEHLLWNGAHWEELVDDHHIFQDFLGDKKRQEKNQKNPLPKTHFWVILLGDDKPHLRAPTQDTVKPFQSKPLDPIEA